MSLNANMERLKYVDYLIRKKATGNLASLASKLRLSKSQTMEFLKEMKQQGFPIEYSRKSRGYYYSENGKVTTSLFQKDTGGMDSLGSDLSKEQLRKITGGNGYFDFYSHSDYIGMKGLTFAI